MRLLSFFALGEALPAPYQNPVTNYRNWYHGTANEFYDEHNEHGDPYADDPAGTRHDLSSPGVAPPHDPGGRLMSPDRTEHEYGQHADKHWNSDLGVHFTSHQDTAEHFAGRGQYQDSRVAHCALHMANPKHYRSEYDLAHEAIEWAHGKGYHYLHKYLRESPETEYHLSHGGHYSDLPDQGHLTHLDDNLGGSEATYHDVDKNGPGGHPGNVKDTYLTMHPDREAIVSGFRQHLQDKGHDGIIYGNEYEPPAGHACAIPFGDHRINMHRWQWLHPDAEEHHNKPEHAPAPLATADEALVTPSWTPEHRQHWVDSEHQKIGRLTAHFASGTPLYKQPKPEFPIEEYRAQQAISDEHAASWAEKRRLHKNRWQHEVRRALSRGDLEPQQAWNNGYKGHGHDQGSGYAHHDDTDRHDLAWEHLPQTLWHCTTNKAGVLADDTLKSRRELSMDHGGSGLGGGEDDTISLTHDLDTARHIHRALHEYHAVVTGKKTVQHMVDEARQGGYLHHVVGGNYGGGKDWKDSDPLPERLTQGLNGRRIDDSGKMAMKTLEEARQVHPEAEPVQGMGHWDSPKGRMHARYSVPMTDDEKRHFASSHYTYHAGMREHFGPEHLPDPGFIMNSAKAMAETHPSQFAIIRVHPKPGARGYRVSALGEWRTADGSSLHIGGLEDPHEQHERLDKQASQDDDPYSDVPHVTRATEPERGTMMPGSTHPFGEHNRLHDYLPSRGGEHRVIQPNHPLLATQDSLDPESVEAFADPEMRAFADQDEGCPPRISHYQGVDYIYDGHHRIVSDRKAGRPTHVLYHEQHEGLDKQAAYLDDDPGPYFHASPKHFSPGDRLVPPGKRKDKITYDHPQGEGWRNDRVWVTKDPRHAAEWHDTPDFLHVYEVKPIGIKQHETTDYDFLDTRSEDSEEDQYQARGAVVVRRLDPSEWNPHAEASRKTAMPVQPEHEGLDKQSTYLHCAPASVRSQIESQGLLPARETEAEDFGHLEDWESAGDADHVWFHQDPKPFSRPGMDTWELTHPHLYDLEEDTSEAATNPYYRTQRVAPEHLRRHDEGGSSKEAALTEPAEPRPALPSLAQPRRAQPNPAMTLLAKSSGQYLPNPYHDHDEWFHGSIGGFDDLDPQAVHDGHRPPGNGSGGPQMNKLLGVHFSALHSVGHSFSGPHHNTAHGRVYHAKLRMKNPRHFASEQHLLRHLWVTTMRSDHFHDPKHDENQQWNYGVGATREGLNRRVDAAMKAEPGTQQDYGPHHAIESYLQFHPRQKEVAEAYVNHLRYEGHDGITYGNSVEGPHNHHCAIAFDPKTIETVHVDRMHPTSHGEPPKFWSEETKRLATERRPGEVSHDHIASIHNEPQGFLDEVERYHNGGMLRSDPGYWGRGYSNTGKGDWTFHQAARQAAKKVYYHVAPAAERDSIAQHGIDWTKGQTNYSGDWPRGNYLFRHRVDADVLKDLREDQEQEEYGQSASPYDVYEVHHHGPVEQDPLHEDESGLGQHSYYTEEPIPAASIRRLGALEPGYTHEHSWLPDHGIFSPSKATLDPTLWTKDQHLRPRVRKTVLDRMDRAVSSEYPDWRRWTRTYLAGGSASYWWGNRDLDILVGVDYGRFRKAHSDEAALSDDQISARLTSLFRQHYNDEHWTSPWDSQEWHITCYSNPASWDIRKIKPYSAYRVDDDRWIVKPPKVHKDWGASQWDESVWDQGEAYLRLIGAIERERDPIDRARRGAMLYHALHDDRRHAFSAAGKGWKDPSNALWKYLEYHPSQPVERLVAWAHEDAAQSGGHPKVTASMPAPPRPAGPRHDQPCLASPCLDTAGSAYRGGA